MSTRRTRRQPKTSVTAQRLLPIIHNTKPGTVLPSVLELCDLLHASKGTLDGALDLLEEQGLIERVPRVGIFVRHQPAMQVMILADSIFPQWSLNSFFWNGLLSRLHDDAQSHRFKPIVCNIEGGSTQNYSLPESVQEMIEEHRVQGVIAIGLHEFLSSYIEDKNIPLVAFAGFATCMVSVDDDQGLAMGVEALAKAGCRHIQHWDGVSPETLQNPNATLKRNAVFAESIARQGIEYSPENVKFFADGATSNMIKQAGYSAAKETLSHPSTAKIDGLVFTHDVFALGALQAMDEMGIGIGTDIKVATHANANSPLLTKYEDDLILIEVYTSEIVEALYDLLSQNMQASLPAGSTRLIRPRIKK